MTDYKKLYEDSLLETAKARREGYEEGRSEGYEEGRSEGYEEGRSEGYDDGYESRKTEEVLRLPTFTKWVDMKDFIMSKTNCKPFTSEGINYRKEHATCILRSVDNTYFYDDDLTDKNLVDYTLQGKNGDQNPDIRNNSSLLNPDLKHIYLYRVKTLGNKKNWIWYGEYTIIGRTTKQHIGEDYSMREIIKLSLKRV